MATENNPSYADKTLETEGGGRLAQRNHGERTGASASSVSPPMGPGKTPPKNTKGLCQKINIETKHCWKNDG